MKKNVSILHLNDQWQVRKSLESNWYNASVPGYAIVDIMEQDELPDPWYRENEDLYREYEMVDWVYRKEFTLSRDQAETTQANLIFEGIDTYADISVNGHKVLTTDNMFLQWEKNIADAIHEGVNEIEIYFHSPVKMGMEKLKKLPYVLQATSEQSPEVERTSIHSRKAPFHYGWDWGPRVIPSGIWRPVRIEFIENVKIKSTYFQPLEVSKSIARYSVEVEIRANESTEVQLFLESGSLKETKSIVLDSGTHTYTIPLEISSPKLWWTHQLGDPYLYDFNIQVKDTNGNTFDTSQYRLGVRSIELVQEEDSIGRNFYFKLNGVPVFMKGANYIPTDYFVSQQTREDYKEVLDDAVDANMNMLRIWGGAIYENDEFYALCDEMGLLLWQDFMFACALQPSDTAHLENIRKEAEYNIKRLRSHPSIALWCGNNENLNAWLEWGWKDMYDESAQETIWKGYQDIFFKILPEAVEKYQPELSYHSSSPSTWDGKLADNKSGDQHVWKVYFGQEPVESYWEDLPRFASEFGMQSFPRKETLEVFADSEKDFAYRSKVFDHRQRSIMEWLEPGGNGSEMQMKYVESRYGRPNGFEDFIYLTQLNQAAAMKNAADAYRANRPHTSGALIWQINDCWPTISWSTVDYNGHWKAAHYKVKKAYSDISVIPHKEGDKVSVYIASDLMTASTLTLEVESVTMDGSSLFSEVKEVTIEANTSKVYFNYSAQDLLNEGNDRNTVTRFSLYDNERQVVSRNILFYDQPKNLTYSPLDSMQWDVSREENETTLSLTPSVFVGELFINFDPDLGILSDNFVDLWPGETLRIQIQGNESAEAIREALRFQSLNQYYEK